MIQDAYDFSEGLEKSPIHFEKMHTISKIKNFKYIKTNIPGPNLDHDLFEEEYEGCDCQNCDQMDVCDQIDNRDHNDARVQISVEQNYAHDQINVRGHNDVHVQSKIHDHQNYAHDPIYVRDHNDVHVQSKIRNQKLCSCITTTGPNYRDNRLIPEIFEHVESKPILECHSNCSCSNSCANRLVQKGIQIKLEVFDAGNKGLGVRSLEFIPRGTFVCEYAGEILTKSEATKRCHNLSHTDMNYLIVLQEHCSSGLLQTFVDPKFKGNIGRLLNHSCQPNLTMFPVRINISVPRLALFANQDIKASEELTFNYGGSVQHGTTTRSSANRTKCCCGSNDCQELLPFDADLCS